MTTKILKNTTKQFFFFFSFFILMFSISLASPQFGPPHQYYGEVNVNGIPAQDDLLITVKQGEKVVGAGKTADGKYGYNEIFVVADTQGNLEGKTLNFFVQGFDTGETVVFSTANTAVTRLDLSISDVDFCGDGVCSSSEDCSTCPDDCGECPSSSSGGGSGGSSSSGGGSGVSSVVDNSIYSGLGTETDDASKTQSGSENGESIITDEEHENNNYEDECVPDWVCSDWLDCISGKQNRVCVDANRCGIDDEKPEESRDCGDHSLDEYAIVGSDDDVKQESAGKNNFNRLTGLFFGGRETSLAGFVLLAGLAILVSAGVYFLAIKK